MKIGLYLDNSKSINTDYTNPDNGNPGIGGTQFMIWSLGYYLAKSYPMDEVFLYAPNIDRLPKITKNIVAKDIYDAIHKSNEQKIDYFICRSTWDKKFYTVLSSTKLKAILWGHNYAKYSELCLIDKCPNVVQYVCVSKEQLEMIVAHRASRKSTYIFNSITCGIYPFESDRKPSFDLCYVGSIVPTKGFDWVAKLWRTLKDSGVIVDLHVIGSGKLYNSKQVLGSYEIAEPEFEKSFVTYLLNENREIDEHIKFHGVLGHADKISVMTKAKYGIVNPTGETETFGISAIEFEALGVPVITRNKGGLKDTVKSDCGFLIDSFEDLVSTAKRALKLYEGQQKEYVLMANRARQYVNSAFDVGIVVKEWKSLLTKLQNDDKDKLIYHGTKKDMITSIKEYIKLILYRQ